MAKKYSTVRGLLEIVAGEIPDKRKTVREVSEKMPRNIEEIFVICSNEIKRKNPNKITGSITKNDRNDLLKMPEQLYNKLIKAFLKKLLEILLRKLGSNSEKNF